MPSISSVILTEEDSFLKLPFSRIFEAQPGALLLLSPQMTIQAATDAYLRETMTTREGIIGRYLFDVFPDNPHAPGLAPSDKVISSIEQVLATGKPHQMELFRYDIPDPEKPGSFVERLWNTSHSPVLGEQGEVALIIHQTSNVTEDVKTRHQLKESQERELAAQSHAQQQQLRLERLFEQTPAAFAQLEGPAFTYKVLNTAYQQLFPGRQLLGLPLFEALPELRDQAVYEIIHQVYNTGETFEGKEVLIPVARYEGQPLEDIYWNFIYQALLDAQGQVNGILIYALDVTAFVRARQQVEEGARSLQELNRELETRVERRTEELRAAQAEALSQQQQLENLFMQAPSAISILDGPELTFQLVNPIYQQIFPGRSLLGRPILEALPELNTSEIPGILAHVYQTGETYVAQEMPLMLARHEGGALERIYWSFTYEPRRNSEGTIDGVLVFAHEVTSHVEARKAVETSAQQLQLITDSLPVLISYLDKEEKYRFANRAYEAWLGIKVEDMVGRTAQEVLGAEAYGKAGEYIRRALQGEHVDYEAAMPYKLGFKHTRTSFVPDVKNGAVQGFYALVMNVTEQVEAREALEKREQEAKAMAEKLTVTNQLLMHTNTDLDNFIYTASHDLKAPISNIEMLMRELLLELPEDTLQQKEVENIIEMMQGAIARFKKTITSLTEISKLQKDHGDKAETVRIKELVQEVKLDLEQSMLKAQALVVTAVEDCTTASFSEKNLRSVVYNLLSNALKYRHPERAPRVHISCRDEGEYLVLRVQDNGLGLKAEQQKKLFSMFRRFHDHVEGSGIGLYMVKRIVDNAGGRIEVESSEGQGTRFSVYIPR